MVFGTHFDNIYVDKTDDLYFKEKQIIMYTTLLVLGIAIFGYLVYVLLKPEKF